MPIFSKMEVRNAPISERFFVTMNRPNSLMSVDRANSSSFCSESSAYSAFNALFASPSKS